MKDFNSKRVFLFDLDGTLYMGKRVLPGARELVSALSRSGKQVFFFTNNSSRSQADYVKKLRKMGFLVRPEQIIMSTHTLITYLKRRGWLLVFLLGTPAMQKMLKAAGIAHIESAKSPRGSRCRAVVVGFDKTITYKKLEVACRMVANGKPYVVTHPDYFCPTDEGPEPDCGSFAKVIELTTKKMPIAVLGKPNPMMIEEAKSRAEKLRKSSKPIKLSEMVLIGDRLMTDIAMGKAAGIDTVLVLTGESQRGDIRTSKFKPSLVVKSVATLLR